MVSQYRAPTVTNIAITVPSEQDGNQSQFARGDTADRTSCCLDRQSGLSGFNWYTNAFLRFYFWDKMHHSWNYKWVDINNFQAK